MGGEDWLGGEEDGALVVSWVTGLAIIEVPVKECWRGAE